jgi:hypothetical protein
MVAYVTESAAGRWFWYTLDPADLAVNPDEDIEGGLTILWRGGTETDRLKTFFEFAASEVCRFQQPHYRASFMTREGPHSIGFSRGDPLLLPHESFVKFDCFQVRPERNDDGMMPVFTVFANRDREAKSLEDLQESVGVSLKSTDLPTLQKSIAEVVAASFSPFFPGHRGYDYAAVMGILDTIRMEVPLLLSR